MSSDGETITAVFKTAGTANPDTAVWVVSVASADGSVARQLGIKLIRGEDVFHYVFEFGIMRQTNLDSPVSRDGAIVTGTFPASAVSDLGGGATWDAAIGLDGYDTDTCPETGDDSMTTSMLPLPAEWTN